MRCQVVHQHGMAAKKKGGVTLRLELSVALLVFLLLDFGLDFGWSSLRLLILWAPYGLFKMGQLEAEVT